MMLVVLGVTTAAVYLAEKNRRTNQQQLLDTQFQSRVESFLKIQAAESDGITEKCFALSHSVRLRAALEERDVDDLYQNAITELEGMLDSSGGASPDATRASFFRFFDGDGVILSPENHPAGFTDQPALQEALSKMAKSLREDDEQAVGFIALARGNKPSALRKIVLTKIRGTTGRTLGELVVGFPLTHLEDTEVDRAGAIQSGIWLDQRFYIESLSPADRQFVSERLRRASLNQTANHFPIDLASGPHLLYYKALDPETQFAPAYQVCLYPLSASIRDEQTLRWKIIAFGLVVLSLGFAASLFVAKGLSRPVEKIVAGSVENLTRRKQAEEDLRETNRELEKALAELKATQQQVIQQERLSAIGQMASGIAHDFNNTLTPILGFSELLLESPKLLDNKPEARRCLEMLRTSAKDAASVVSRLREFYRPVETDEEFPVVDLAKIVQQAVALTEPKWRRQTQATGVTVQVTAEAKALPFVAGQESALREVLTNLIFNAVDAMPQGGRIFLETSIENGEAVVRVRDNGTGMTESVRQRCLEPFFSTKGERGTGLGLSMVYGIIERHRGKLEIESAPGHGTTFIIRLPIADTSAIQGSESFAQAGTKSSLNVLIVDDEPRVLEVVSAYLRFDGHSVSTAASGREGLEKFRRDRFDLVVLDRVMPEMSGDQTARFIKQVNDRIPVIMLTGFGALIEVSGSQPAAVDVVLSKPVTLDALRKTIGKLLHAA
ncbi:MAG TPA: ATP-binding protein [Chthoniobacterales bacterium]|jgi:signal transduction histidine kinase|nr:ATP-binding protein [Chthoniobacterales bacterium]